MSATSQLCEQKQSDQKRGVEFKQIMVATDFSEASERALAHAAAIARHFGSSLWVVQAIPPDARDQIPIEALPREMDRRWLETEEKMKELTQKAKIDDLKPNVVLQRGPVWDVLRAVIREESIDLLLLGTHGRGGLRKLVLGSVAEEVVRLAGCPVLTVGPNAPAVGSGEFRNILFATDFGLASTKAFPYALSLAENSQGKLVLLHAIPPAMPNPDLGPASYGPSSYAADEFIKWQRTMRDEGTKRLQKLLPSGANLAPETECIASDEFLPEAILDIAASHNTDLIVMGADRTSAPWVAAHTPWVHVHEVICKAKCPVLTVASSAAE